MKVACLLIAASIAAPCSAGLTVLGFTVSRGGEYSLQDGTVMANLRSAIVTSFPGAAFHSVETLTASDLSASRVVFLMATTSGHSAISPLTEAEGQLLVASVLAGRGAVIFTDNSSFAGSASDPANSSLLNPFGIDSTGTGSGWPQSVTVITPESSQVTSGRFGLVPEFFVGWSGWFYELGGATTLATLNENNQPALAVIPRGALGPGSGAVVLFADCSMVGGEQPENYAVMLNAIDYAANLPCTGDLNADGFVDDSDFTIFVTAYNILDCADPTMPSGCASDFNSDGLVDDADFVIFVPAYNALLCS